MSSPVSRHVTGGCVSARGRIVNDRRPSRAHNTTAGSGPQVMPFRKTSLKGPCWVADGRARLLQQQQQRHVDVVQRMSCELYNALLKSWRHQWL